MLYTLFIIALIIDRYNNKDDYTLTTMLLCYGLPFVIMFSSYESNAQTAQAFTTPDNSTCIIVLPKNATIKVNTIKGSRIQTESKCTIDANTRIQKYLHSKGRYSLTKIQKQDHTIILQPIQLTTQVQNSKRFPFKERLHFVINIPQGLKYKVKYF